LLLVLMVLIPSLLPAGAAIVVVAVVAVVAVDVVVGCGADNDVAVGSGGCE
jgi:hypothetical protein